MLARSIFAAASCLGAVCVSPVLAQGAAETGTGDGPTSTIRAPNTTAVGQTKPPGAAAPPANADTQEAHAERMKKEDKIMKGICIGCGAK